jgi:hypothetical protein
MAFEEGGIVNTRDHFVSGVAQGWGEMDWAALAKVVTGDAVQ